MKKMQIAMTMAALAALAHGATVPISAGDVTALTNAIATYRTSATTLQLAPGDYDLTGLQMEEEGSTYGKSHLLVSGVKLLGMGEKPEDVRLIGDGTCRVYRMIKDTYATLQNLTITNGYAKTIEKAADSKHGGGIYGYPTVTNCVIIGNKADGNGGGCYGYTYIRACKILNNTAASGGGAFRVNYVINSLVSGNHSTSHGGGINGDSYGRVEGSTVVGNVADGAGGAICAVNSVTNCYIAENVSASGGGALYSWDRATKYVYDCTICSNKTSTTGGAVYEYTVVGGKIFGNYAQNGGGAGFCSLVDVELHDNYAQVYGGGTYNCNATNCVFRNNFMSTESGKTHEGPNSFSSYLYGCDVSGTGLYSGSAVNCVVHDVVDSAVIEGNPYAEGAAWAGHVYAGIPNCTNCLFRNNRVLGYSRALFCGIGSAKWSGSVINCTIVSNKYGKTFDYMYSTNYPVHVKNCVFVWNEGYDTTSWRDLHGWENLSSNCLHFANCAYGSATGLFVDGKACGLADSSDGPMYKFGADGFGSDPKFALKGAAHPFEPRPNSPLVGIGAVEAWMAAVTDIRGDGYARLREGKVDIGCYQCWLNPAGTTILLR